MAPTARTRNRSALPTSWTQDIYGSVSGGGNVPDYTESTEDIIGNFGGENFFKSKKIRTKGGHLNGTYSGRTYSNRGTYARSAAFLYLPAQYDFGSPSNVTTWATKTAALTNPSRPEISLPTFIGELKDVPRMIRHAGRFLNGTAFKHGNNGLSAAKEVAAENLAIQFGWAPLISDLAKMVEFQKRFDKRTKELNRLYSGSGLKRRIKTLSEYSHESSYWAYAWSTHGIYVYLKYTQMTKVKFWSTIRWAPDTPARIIPGSEEHQKRLLGLHPSEIASTAWELLPWSFLIDYFTNIGKYISLTNNHLGAKCLGGSIMKHEVSRTSWSSWSAPSGTLVHTEGYREQEVKQRRPFTVYDFSPLNGSFPILTGKQMSILHSLAMLRV